VTDCFSLAKNHAPHSLNQTLSTRERRGAVDGTNYPLHSETILVHIYLWKLQRRE